MRGESWDFYCFFVHRLHRLAPIFLTMKCMKNMKFFRTTNGHESTRILSHGEHRGGNRRGLCPLICSPSAGVLETSVSVLPTDSDQSDCVGRFLCEAGLQMDEHGRGGICDFCLRTQELKNSRTQGLKDSRTQENKDARIWRCFWLTG